MVSLAIVDDATHAPLPHRAAGVTRVVALAPFSEDHERELGHARRLLSAADDGPEERLAAARAYVAAFFGETVEHFRREEEELFPLYARHGGRRELVERILEEHMQLQGLVRALRTHVVAGDVAAEELRTLGSLLLDHVRMEERELFEHIQQVVPEAELAELLR